MNTKSIAELEAEYDDTTVIQKTNQGHIVEYLKVLPTNVVRINKYHEQKITKDEYYFDLYKCRIIKKNKSFEPYLFRFIRSNEIKLILNRLQRRINVNDWIEELKEQHKSSLIQHSHERVNLEISNDEISDFL